MAWLGGSGDQHGEFHYFCHFVEEMLLLRLGDSDGGMARSKIAEG